MVIRTELVFKSYMPKTLEIGMWFIHVTPDEIKIWELDKIPREPIEKFIVENGAPVEPFIIYEDDLLVEPEHIGWMDDGPDTDELREITLEDINIIVNEYDGEIDLEIDEQLFDEDWEVAPLLYEGKVTISLPDTYYEEEEENYEEDN